MTIYHTEARQIFTEACNPQQIPNWLSATCKALGASTELDKDFIIVVRGFRSVTGAFETSLVYDKLEGGGQ